METQSIPDAPRLSDVVRLSSTGGVAEALRHATETRTPVIPMGGGTSLHTGNATSDTYLGLDLRRLSGVREYSPTDLTVSFRAGTTLAEVQRVLGEHGQELPVDMAFPETATIGGMVATGFAGPRRLGSGTLKDLIIGCEYVRGDGLVAKAGGMLVKNVSGFEIPRFLHGSWGSLAVITAINLKVVPKPKADASLVHRDETLAASLEAQRTLIARRPGLVAAVTERDGDGWSLTVRLQGRPASLEAQVRSLREELGEDAQVREGDAHWRAYNDRWAVDDGQVRIVAGGKAEPLRELATVVDRLAGVSGLAVSLGTGTLRCAFPPDVISREGLESCLRSLPVTWTIESAPATWRGPAPVWGAGRNDRALVEAIKAEFDPAGILNRGRLII